MQVLTTGWGLALVIFIYVPQQNRLVAAVLPCYYFKLKYFVAFDGGSSPRGGGLVE